VLLPFIVFCVTMSIAYVSYTYQAHRFPRRFAIQSMPSPIDRGISLYIRGILGLTTYVVMVGFAPFRCYQQPDGSYSLVPSSDLSCYDQDWFSHMFIIVLGLIEIILLPLGVFLIFQIKLQENKFRWRFGILTLSFKAKYYWWEVVVLMKKLCFVMMVDLTNDFDPSLRVFFAEIVLLIGFLSEYVCQPRKEELRTLHTLYNPTLFLYLFSFLKLQIPVV
jgi:hypothetical protein